MRCDLLLASTHVAAPRSRHFWVRRRGGGDGGAACRQSEARIFPSSGLLTHAACAVRPPHARRTTQQALAVCLRWRTAARAWFLAARCSRRCPRRRCGSASRAYHSCGSRTSFCQCASSKVALRTQTRPAGTSAAWRSSSRSLAEGPAAAAPRRPSRQNTWQGRPATPRACTRSKRRSPSTWPRATLDRCTPRSLWQRRRTRGLWPQRSSWRQHRPSMAPTPPTRPCMRNTIAWSRRADGSHQLCPILVSSRNLILRYVYTTGCVQY
mmetsp:Transcript_35900/g.106096  ORF Transcript_35900/g.106096 Transcript_35900/m.106096 type:complete len:267 (+) Transcript_35900:1129-1929(+)